MVESLEAGANRFGGFAGLYDEVRPSPPDELGSLLTSYRGSPPALVVDLGSGTGLSTRWAARWADNVVGVEPSDDMRAVASSSTTNEAVSFRKGWSHETGLPSGCADVVTVVQAFHWMEPGPTLAEVDRLLKAGGVFAAIDCDWPPSVGDALAEAAWDVCRRRIRVFETRLTAGAVGADLLAPVSDDDRATTRYSGIDAHDGGRALPEGVRSWSKNKHLEQIAASGRFAWWREVALGSIESGDAARFVGLQKSQGDYQTLLRHGADDGVLGVQEFARVAEARLGATARPWLFTWRVRLGFKA